MKKIDVKHILFHILVALYAIWVVVYGILLSMTFANAITHGANPLSRVLAMWLLLNLVMGTALFIVIRLFRRASPINKFVLYTYFIMAGATIAALLTVNSFA